MIEALMRVRQAVIAQAQRAQMKVNPELIVGAGKLYDAAALLRAQGVRCVMVVTTPGFVRRGLIATFTRDLLTHGITPAVFSDVCPDPDFQCIGHAAGFYRSHGCEAMVAIGGGSVMDCAKVAGACIARPDKDIRELLGTMKVGKPLPYMVAVPTTAGTGSEVTAAAVVTDTERKRKYAVADIALIPDAAILDATLLAGLPSDLTAYTGMDALTHAVEAFINRYASRAARSYAEDAVAMIFENLKRSYDDGENLGLRENMLLASYYAGIAFSNAMVGYVHALAHGIGGRYHVQHGLANAVLLPAVLEEFGAAAQPRLAKLAKRIGVPGSSDQELAQGFINRIRALQLELGIPPTIPQIREEDIAELAAGAEAEGNPAYPVPEIWTRRRFQKVLKAVSGSAVSASGGEAQGAKASTGQNRITKPGPLLDDAGMLREGGWATSQLLDYSRLHIKASALRVKEWDYYLVTDDEYALAITVGDMGYAALASVAVIDYAAGASTTASTMGLLPMGRLGLPSSSGLGVTQFSDKKASMCFTASSGMRHLKVSFADFREGEDLSAEVVLDCEPRDSMVIATPWLEDDRAFYYNQKIVGMRALGMLCVGDATHRFDDADALGLLDWGRGVWTRDNTWFWSAAQGRQNGRLVAFNLGYGFGDTTAASENMVFVDGVAHKLGRVDFGIPLADAGAQTVGERYRLMEPWHFTDDEGRLDLTFTPQIDRNDFMDFKVVVSDQHQVFGVFDGWVRLDDGSKLEVSALRGFAEAVHNKY